MPGPLFYLLSPTYIADLNALSNGLYTPSPQTVGFTAVRGFWYILKNNGVTVTLPISPAQGDRIRFSSATSSVTSVTLGRNGNPINSAASDLTITSLDSGTCIEAVYVDSTIGWRVITPSAGTIPSLTSKSTDFTAAKGTVYLVTAGSLNVTPPSSPAAGDWFQLVYKDFATAGPTIKYNGTDKVRSAAADFPLTSGFDINLVLVYIDSTIGWQLHFVKGKVKKAPAISGNVLTLELDNGMWPDLVFDVSLNANITTLTVNNYPASGAPYCWEIVFTADGTQRTITWPASHKWPQGVSPTMTSTNTKKDRTVFETIDGGTTVFAGLAGQSY